MQHATDWKNVAAEVIPIGVEDCSALYTYVSIVAVVLKIEPLAPWKAGRTVRSRSKDLSDIQDEHHDMTSLSTAG